MAVQEALIRGRLHDRFDYPAMTAGNDRVRGELWSFLPDAMPRVLETLDQVEGTNQPDQPDLYIRVVVNVVDQQDHSLGTAYAYFYATDPELAGFRPITANGRDVAWPP